MKQYRLVISTFLLYGSIIVIIIFFLLYITHCRFIFQVDRDLEIKAYYAGHVLGAAMFHIKVGSQSLVYTVSI